MTLEEKQAYIVSALNDPANIIKLIRLHILNTMSTYPEAVLDIIIQGLDYQEPTP